MAWKQVSPGVYRTKRGGKVRVSMVKRKKPTVSKPLKRAIKKVVASREETKYHAEQLLMKQSLDWAIHTPWTPSTVGDTMPLVPRIQQGDGNFERVGSKVRPVKCRVSIDCSIAEAAIGTTPINTATEDIKVVMYILRPKTSRNFYQFTNPVSSGALGSAYTDELLDNGDGTSKPFGYGIVIGGTSYVYSNASDLHLPVNKEYFTLVRKKIVRLTKNQGSTNGDGTGFPSVAVGSANWSGSFTYKLPTLRYDDDAKTSGFTGGYPTNANMVLCIGAVLGNNMDSIQYIGGEPSSILPNPVMLNVRTHYWYKDA